MCADEIHAKIKDGTYPAGQWLPLIKDLREQLNADADAATVREALALLTDQGVVVHEQFMGRYPAGEKPEHGPSKKRKAVKPEPTQPQTSAAFLDNEFVTVAEIALYLRISTMTAYRLVKDLPCVIRVGRGIRIPSASVRAFLKESGYQVELAR